MRLKYSRRMPPRGEGGGRETGVVEQVASTYDVLGPSVFNEK